MNKVIWYIEESLLSTLQNNYKINRLDEIRNAIENFKDTEAEIIIIKDGAKIEDTGTEE